MTPHAKRLGSGFERLEEKSMCAVQVYVSAHVLTIVGDANANEVAITQDAQAGTTEVAADGNHFTIDSANVDRIFADLGAGDDELDSNSDKDTRVLGRQGDDDVDVLGHGHNRINGGLGQDSARSLGSFTVFVMKDDDYDRVLEPILGSVRFVGDQFSFKAFHRFDSHANINTYRGNKIVVHEERVEGYGPERFFFTTDVYAKNGTFKEYGGLQQMAPGYPPGASPGGLRLYVPMNGEVRIIGIYPAAERIGPIVPIYVM